MPEVFVGIYIPSCLAGAVPEITLTYSLVGPFERDLNHRRYPAPQFRGIRGILAPRTYPTALVCHLEICYSNM